MLRALVQLFHDARRRLRWSYGSGLSYWEERADRLGALAVMHRGHPPERMGAVTEELKRRLFPLLACELTGHERMALDFGCGAGRFTADLARTIRGRAVGVDPVAGLLQLAPHAEGVEFRPVVDGAVPLATGAADVVFIVQVLGAITGALPLARVRAELDRALARDGLLFLVENTTAHPPTRSFRLRRTRVRVRSAAEYRALLDFVDLKVVGGYEDLGETFSVMAGRRPEGVGR